MQTLQGIVISNKMPKTVVVERTLTRAHPLYKKIIRSRQRIKAHTEIPLVVGDVVKLVAVRPISKDKHYKVVEKVT